VLRPLPGAAGTHSYYHRAELSHEMNEFQADEPEADELGLNEPETDESELNELQADELELNELHEAFSELPSPVTPRRRWRPARA